jgi:catechol 2,3-dioxygenase-like lactoylglutathione lyase family enzyme
LASSYGTAIEGVTLLVSDVGRSKEFYMRIPGAQLVYERAGEFALLRIGQFRLQLLPRGELHEGAPAFHLEATASDVDALMRRSRPLESGRMDRPVDHSWGDRSFHATDPIGT